MSSQERVYLWGIGSLTHFKSKTGVNVFFFSCEWDFVCNFSPQINITVLMPTSQTGGGSCRKERRSWSHMDLVYPRLQVSTFSH